MAELQLRSDTSGRAKAHCQSATPVQKIDPHILALDIFSILMKVRKKFLGLGRVDLMVQ